jgi:glyoxylase-like metal-dependent hydrolase (beta-lactamase superfamily II)
MFGVVPKVVWARNVPADGRGRMEVAHNCLLLERVGEAGPDAGPQIVLVEAGSGDKMDAKMKAIFGLSDRTVADAARDAGVRPEDVGAAVVSHLHFDHCGGLTRRPRDGEAGIQLSFPRAEVIVQRREWDDATANNSTMTRTYLRENLEPLAPRLRLADSPPPFPAGYHPRRDEPPPGPLVGRTTPVLPGIDVFLVPGHTWGQQAIRFTDDRGRAVVFPADLIPTVNHVGAAYNMAYDVEPYTSTVTRRWFLDEAARGDWLLVLDHEPGNPCQRVRADGKGWFELVPEEDM